MHASFRPTSSLLPLLLAPLLALPLVVACGETDGDDAAAVDATVDVVTFGDSAELPGDVGTDAVDADDGPVGDDVSVHTDENSSETSDTGAFACPGGPGCVCVGNDDCDNSLCLQQDDGGHCALHCVDSCPDGFTCAQMSAGGSDLVGVCVPGHPHLCDPCAEAADCKGLGYEANDCIDHGHAGSFCGTPCVLDDDCPNSYACQDVVNAKGGDARQCVPPGSDGADFGACTCSEAAVAAELQTACYVAVKDAGGEVIAKCPGTRQCKVAGLGACEAPSPEDEVCDGKDNDCDAQTDEATCDDGNFCTIDSCGGDKGCQNKAAVNGLACDADGNVCTENDACKDGQCEQGGLKNCDDGNPCSKDSCELALGCTQTFDDGAPCDDDNPCTIGDLCAQGQCGSGLAKTCASGKACVVGECSLVTGKCVFANLKEGKPCDDGDKCSKGDACKGGACDGDIVNCDDANPCTDDSCKAASGCDHSLNQVPCSDGDACTTGDVCKAGACVAGPAKTCDDKQACTQDSCVAATGDCAFEGKGLEGAPCDADGSVCTKADECKAGKCAPGPVQACDDGNGCTDDGCDPKVGCQHSANVAVCVAGDLCTQGDICKDKACIAGKPTVCAPETGCTKNACAAQTGKCVTTPAADTSPCDDGDPCTQSDFCLEGKCKAGLAKICTTDKPCLAASCDSKTGACVLSGQSKEDAACDADGSACTVKDVCKAGVCKPGQAPDCGDGKVCTTDSCDKLKGCVHGANTVACDADGSDCTVGDACKDGSCVAGAKKTCDDGNICTLNQCDAKAGCTAIPFPLDCPDNDKCTTEEKCQGGKCVTKVTACDDSNPCTTDTCDPKTGCVHKNVADGAGCGAGKTCVAGKCTVKDKNGCAPGMAFSMKIVDDLWLCAMDNITGNNNYVQVYSACNEASGFHMGTVTSMTRRGLPPDSAIGQAMTWAKSKGYDYAVSGQPVRAFSWDYNKTPYETTSCGGGGLGYIGTSEKTGSGSNWKALTDGNGAEYRSWPAANCVEVKYHTLIALCQDASADPKAWVYDHRWR